MSTENIQIKSLEAWNFLCYGPEGFQLDLRKLSNIVLIQGENRDAKPIDSDSEIIEESRISSNGSGKSSIQEILVWTLYGKTVKRPEKIGKNQVIHNRVGKDCRTVVEIGKYRVERCRSGSGKGKDTVRLWESEDGIWDKTTEITTGDSRLTDKEIEKKIGLSYDAFVNICIFTDDQRSCFLECVSDDKMEIVENLMQLEVYREWWDSAKILKKEVKNNIEIKSKEFSLLLGNKDDTIRRIEISQKKKEDWTAQKVQEKVLLENKITLKTSELGKSNIGQALVAYQKAQDVISSVNLKIPEIEENKEKLDKRIVLIWQKDAAFKKEAQEVSEIFSKLSREMKSHLEDRNKRETKIADLSQAVAGTRCDDCYGEVQECNIGKYISNLNAEIYDLNLEMKKCKINSESVAVKAEVIKVNQTKLKQIQTQDNQKIKEIDSELKQLRAELTAASQVREPKAESAELLLQQQIEEFTRQLKEKEKEIIGNSPVDGILENDKLELETVIKKVEEKEKEVKDLEAEIINFDYWIHGFGPDGIRKWVIDGIIPDLNDRVNYWLQFLIDNRVTLKFNNKLEEKIERNPPDGDPYIYYAMSTGQRRRLNLAVGHSFAYITELSAEAIPSVIFLDEVTTNVDISGTIGIYKMICELSQDKQVFVTTHDNDLVRMLQGCAVIDLVHENGFTKLNQ